MARVTTVTRKGQITIPKEVRDQLGLQPSDAVEVWAEGKEVRIRKTRRLTLQDIAGSIPAGNISVEEAISLARRERAEARAESVARQLSESELSESK